jgi:hypothetical protein
MSALEQELIARIRKLDAEKQRQVLNFVQKIEAPETSLGAWLKDIDSLREELIAKYGTMHFPGVAELLNEIREERDNDILNSLRR